MGKSINLAARTAALLCALCSACTQDILDAGQPGGAGPRFFDVAVFVAEQDSVLRGTRLEKTVDVNGERQTIAFDSVDWGAELAAFSQSSIERPALWDKYVADSTRVADGERVVYSALDSSLFTRQVTVEFGPERRVRGIDIDNRFSSLIANTKQRLHWEPGKYSVYSEQRVRFGGERLLSIEGDWEPGEDRADASGHR